MAYNRGSKSIYVRCREGRSIIDPGDLSRVYFRWTTVSRSGGVHGMYKFDDRFGEATGPAGHGKWGRFVGQWRDRVHAPIVGIQRSPLLLICTSFASR